MLQRVTSTECVDVDSVLCDADPQAACLAEALAGCLHPKAGRLLRRLSLHPSENELVELRREVRELLMLSFGPTEARRRLQ
jgi:hypothetical protein